ncbi:hypothetical protein EOL73_04215 [Candidatus Saccharibacteria bacterium]|nr:hypothetical protein [Candidatus Saccharibacteria bacterium]NCU40931.1 hypothetical protein [Candidatus Saccharibacteria bacterium]
MDICLAIKNHNYLEFLYEGYARKVIPFAHGLHAKTRTGVMRGLQVGGASKSGKFDVPKLFETEKMSNIIILEELFANLPDGYKKDDKHINPIECQL